ncbi:MAG: hypothetical protein FJ118_10745 [Deltaproteobacteria bacterium]|nr:hypothetical protein [Deltaproteobacteria bacterium]
MKPDHTAHETDLSCIPAPFRENYRFLSELISCKDRNNSLKKRLANLDEWPLAELRGRLNRRQMKLVKDFLNGDGLEGMEPLECPVPAELEAAILVKKRASWLPWEAEAIRKADRWRADVRAIAEHLGRTIKLCVDNGRSTRVPKKMEPL